MNRLLSRLPKNGFLSGTISKVLTIGILSASLPLFVQIEPSVAQTCNVFGCSQPGASACNPFGCPNPGAAPCTPFGCPASPTPAASPAAQPPVIYQQQPQPQIGGSPQAIQQCMENLLYRTEVQKPFSGWICVANDVNCRTVRVRTEISEAAAVQACQNAR
ncbi:hypothetical protein QUA82_13415 [Microcoleus sp. F8-D3]